MIAEVIGWKFNHQPGMRCREVDGALKIVNFPGGVPSQADQDLWTSEYNTYVASGGLLAEMANIDTSIDPIAKAIALVFLSEINLLRTAAGLPVRTITQLKEAVKAKL